MPKTEPLCFPAQFAEGRNCVSTDRDGEGRMALVLSDADAAKVIARMGELREGFYCTLVPMARVKR